jgi:hypothetical protein
MKTIRFFKNILLICFGLCFQTCQKIEIHEDQNQSKTFSLSLLAQPVLEQTKAAYLGFDFGWEAGDMAAIIAPNNRYTPLTLDSLSVGKKLGAFKGTLNGWAGEQDIYVIYPWNPEGKNLFSATSATYQFDLREIQTFDCSTPASIVKDNARYSLMLGKTKQAPVTSVSMELNQMMSFLDFSVTNVGANKVLEVQLESTDSVFTKSSVFNLIDQSNIAKSKTKKLTIAAVNNSSGDVRLPLTILPVNLSPTGLNKSVFADVIVEDGTTKELKLYRFNKGVPSKPYEKNTRYLAILDLNTITPNAYTDELYLDLKEKEVDYIASSFQVNVSSNGRKWAASEMPDWVTLNKTSGETSGIETINVKTNTHFLPRTATITFSAGNEKRTLTINQSLNKEVASDKAALEAFFAAAGGENWINKTNWLSDKPLSEWSYISTDSETGRVNSLAIRNSENLRGSLSEETYKLTEMRELYLFNMEPQTFRVTLFESVKNLNKLEILYLVLTDNVPNEIFDLKNLKKLTLTSPPGSNVKLIGKERFSNLINLSELTMWVDLGLEFPKGIFSLTKLEKFACGLQGNVPSSVEIPDQFFDLTNLKWIDTGYKFRFSSRIGNLKDLEWINIQNLTGELTKEFFSLSKLSWVWIGSTLYHSDLEGSILPDIKNMTNLKSISIINCDLTGNLPKELANLNLDLFRCDGNRLSGKIPFEVLNHPKWENWSPNRWVLPQQEGYKFEIEKYVSTDFSEDGKIVKLHSATKGKGIDIVVLGDGFVDKEIGPGKIYDLTMTKFKDSFLELEPFKTYKDYFNVYMIRAVSKEHGVSDEGNKVLTKFGTITSQNILPSYNIEKVQNYVDSLGLDNSHINLIANSYSIGANAAILPDTNSGIVKTATLMGVNADTYTISHESGGHGFGLLADEYMKSCNELFPLQDVEPTRQMQEKYGIYTNVDFTSDLTKIRWAHMVNHPKYKGTVAAYEGGLYYYKGVWRAEYQSIMGYWVGYKYYNAPSREAIVKQIKKQAGEPYLFEDFVANDKIEILIDYNNKSATIPGKERKQYPPRVIMDGKEITY